MKILVAADIHANMEALNAVLDSVEGQYGGFISLGGQPSIYLAWRRSQCLSRLAASPVFLSLGGKASVYPAWRMIQARPL